MLPEGMRYASSTNALRTMKKARALASALKFSQKRRSAGRCEKGRAFWARPFVDATANFYFRCLLTSLVISNIETCLLPPNTGRRLSSALIMRRFFESWRPFRRM